MEQRSGDSRTKTNRIGTIDLSFSKGTCQCCCIIFEEIRQFKSCAEFIVNVIDCFRVQFRREISADQYTVVRSCETKSIDETTASERIRPSTWNEKVTEIIVIIQIQLEARKRSCLQRLSETENVLRLSIVVLLVCNHGRHHVAHGLDEQCRISHTARNTREYSCTVPCSARRNHRLSRFWTKEREREVCG